MVIRRFWRMSLSHFLWYTVCNSWKCPYPLQVQSHKIIMQLVIWVIPFSQKAIEPGRLPFMWQITPKDLFLRWRKEIKGRGDTEVFPGVMNFEPIFLTYKWKTKTKKKALHHSGYRIMGAWKEQCFLFPIKFHISENQS